MDERLVTDKAVIEPIYPQSKPNDPIEFGRVQLECSSGRRTYRGPATVTLTFTPRDRLLFRLPADAQSPFGPIDLIGRDKWDGKLRLTDRGVEMAAICVQAGSQGGRVRACTICCDGYRTHE